MKKKIVSNSFDQPKASKPFHVQLFLLLFVLVAVIFLRLPLLDMPLERDEGGFAYIAKMMLGDKNLYTDLHDSKLPLLYIIYAVFIKLFGYNAMGIHLGLLVFNIATILVIYHFISTVFNRNIGLMTSILYAIQSLNPLMLGFATHATQLLMLPVSIGLWLHYRALMTEKIGLLFWAGFFIGLSFLIKQQVIGFIFFGLIYNIYNDFQAKKSLKHVFLTTMSFGLGTITPYLTCVVYMLLSGRFSEFWFWTIKYPGIERISKNWGDTLEPFIHFFSFLSAGSSLFWLFGTLGIVVLVKTHWSFSNKIYTVLLLLLSFFSVATGYHFYPHYFILMVLPVSLINGIFFEKLSIVLSKTRFRKFSILPILLFIVTVSQPFFTHPTHFFDPDLSALSHKMYKGNPFVEAEKVGQVLSLRSQPTDKIAILGSEPEILVAANRESALSQIYVYSLVSKDSFAQAERLKAYKELRDNLPRFVVLATANSSWMNESGTREVDSFSHKILAKDYKLIGTAYTPDHVKSFYYWDKQSLPTIKSAKASENALFIFEIKNSQISKIESNSY